MFVANKHRHQPAIEYALSETSPVTLSVSERGSDYLVRIDKHR